jgi:ubiquinone/menaquinone biosynthesis C-methylase UbiE
MALSLSRNREIPAERRAAPRMEGAMARWYARNRGSAGQLTQYRSQAAALTADLPDGADVLEVAPGPGYLAIEIARRGSFRVTGIDLSRSFVEIASANARQAGVTVDFQLGDAGRLPFSAESFDLVVCQAAFKNFPRPVVALDEMYRVLRPEAIAVIHDMNRDATGDQIDREVSGMGLSRWDAVMTRVALSALRYRAATPQQFERLVAASAFGSCNVAAVGIGLEIRLIRPRAV